MGLNPARGVFDKLGRDMVLRWRPYLERYANGTEDMGFVLGFIAKESGGDPCSIGGGNLDEIGIVQHNVPKTGQHAGQIIGESGKPFGISRDAVAGACHADGSPPTDDEMDVAAKAAMMTVQDCMEIADGAIARTGVPWTRDTYDYWCLVKQSHSGGAGTVNGMLDAAVSELGTSITFKQFASHAIDRSPSPGDFTAGPFNPGMLGSNVSKFTPALKNRLADTLQWTMTTALYFSGETASPGDSGGSMSGGSDSSVTGDPSFDAADRAKKFGGIMLFAGAVLGVWWAIANRVIEIPGS